MNLTDALFLFGVVTGTTLFIWRAITARRAWIRYVHLYRAKIDPDYTDPRVPLLGWPIEPGWRENTPRHPKSYSKNWKFEDGFRWLSIRYDEQDDPEIEAARREVSDREFEALMTMILGGFVWPIVLMAIPGYISYFR